MIHNKKKTGTRFEPPVTSFLEKKWLWRHNIEVIISKLIFLKNSGEYKPSAKFGVTMTFDLGVRKGKFLPPLKAKCVGQIPRIKKG